MAEATPATAVPNARLSGSKRKKVWAEALDAWLQQLAQERVQEHTSQALTPQNVRASLELLLAKVNKHDDYFHQKALSHLQQRRLSLQRFPQLLGQIHW
ncbi:MAG: hypothetical protein FRX49_11123 [Trebouxia sp. A1-2]|nr:MAG: hypothetical protein FRX49_11123 [Trebouxia sp. A1-2]